MQTPASNIWWPRGASFVFAALAAASASFWALKVSTVNAAISAPVAAMAGSVVIDSASVARALGGSLEVSPVASSASRFAMLGVLADQHSAGAALISVDGKRAKPYRVGDALEDGLILQSVQGRKATLGAAPGTAAVLTLELPAPKQ